MSGRKLRKEGYLQVKLLETPTTIQRLSAVTLKSHRSPLESWRNAYVTLRYGVELFFSLYHSLSLSRYSSVDRLNIYLHKSDPSPVLSYTLL